MNQALSIMMGELEELKQKLGAQLWGSANSVIHWVSTAYRQQKKNLKKIRGYKFIEELYKLSSRLELAKDNIEKNGGYENITQRRVA